MSRMSELGRLWVLALLELRPRSLGKLNPASKVIVVVVVASVRVWLEVALTVKWRVWWSVCVYVYGRNGQRDG